MKNAPPQMQLHSSETETILFKYKAVRRRMGTSNWRRGCVPNMSVSYLCAIVRMQERWRLTSHSNSLMPLDISSVVFPSSIIT